MSKMPGSNCARIIFKAGAKETRTYLSLELAGDDSDLLGVDPLSEEPPIEVKTKS